MTAPLAGIRVLERAQGIAGPMVGKLFVDAGAEVVKLEPPEGDELRRFRASGSPTGGDGVLFSYLNAGKSSITADLADGALDELLAGTDLLIDDGDLELEVEELRRRHPRLVIVSISAYGRSGPWAGRPASDLIIQAESGSLQFRGPMGRPPVQAGGRITEFLGATFAAAPALAALMHAEDTGRGAHIDVSIHDVMALSGSNHMDLVHQLSGAPDVGPPVRFLDTPGIEQAADGLVAFNTNAAHMMQMFLLMIGHPDLMDDPEFLSFNGRLARGAEWQTMIDDWVSHNTVTEIIDRAVELRVPVAPCHDGASIATDEQLVARDVFVEGTDGISRPRPPYRLDGKPLTPADLVATVGEHDSGRPMWAPRPSATDLADLADDGRPLAGLKVVDLTSWWVGALCTQILGRLGADVVHVEGPGHPDGMRLTGKMFATTDAWWEFGHMFAAVDTDRRAVCIDLTNDAGRDVLWSLIERADVLVENFAPRVADSWGLTHEAVLERNPSIVYMRMPAFGLDGPWRDRPAFAQTIEPMSTMSSITGFADGRPVSKGGLPDPVGGSTGAWAVLVALAARRRSGRGVAVESVMLDAALNVSAQPVLEFLTNGIVMGREGNRSSHAAPQGVFQVAGDGEWVAVSVTTDAQWHQLALLIGGGELAADSRFTTHSDRIREHDRLDELLAQWLEGHGADDAVEQLSAVGVPAGVCRDPRLLRHHPQYIGRGLFESSDHPVLGTIEVPGQPYRMSGVDNWITRAAPTFGEHNAEVLAEAGLAPDLIDELTRTGILADRPTGL